MQTIIFESCRFTRLGLIHSLAVNGIGSRETSYANSLEDLQRSCEHPIPRIILINESCLPIQSQSSTIIRNLIVEHPQSLFIIFMSSTNNHFEQYVFVRENVIITSKSIKTATLNQLLSHHVRQFNLTGIGDNRLNISPVVLSRSESNMLKMWMSGEGTTQISDKLRIKVKTVSSYKGSIKRKIKSQNKHIIYHVVRLSDSLTEGIYVS
ncbi:transcriptional regulator RcsA [Rouxiella badensis]|jgi:LuxR family capsular biosynthesis transcriptional activator|uniref:transcriptional regulator RcsA n=1 Tax=Rouxiella badensis TaxID=1646377 RepID=UPI0013EEF7D3|nr:transcriptional regulator RcsA [Rouxiella badensis]MCC3704440.1 transcriptional regulator RcsA [Rouxiella badensis]MCC3718523.1 transcriptional regulator RcsA [Rouxiella badensis]MCC3726709.1 transcriptional regulator RcsA [Rouxiella badensis]MCC3738941.1 transcriptional regulator RcsA [Rouxiella badensis]MCC3746487.1 transcriptional regulator RcsA [Rouxiella badensis]